MHRFLNKLTFSIFLIVTGVSGKTSETSLTAHSVGRSLAKCLGDPTIGKCLQNEALKTLDILLSDNSTWQYSDIIEFEKDQNFTVYDQKKSGRFENDSRSPGDVIAEKLLQLAQARSIRMTMNPKSLLEGSGRADNLDFEEEGGEKSRKKQKIWYLNHSLKGRKKKDKNKGVAMMGGLAMIAMIAQMFLGKVLLLAGAAFVMSKIALIVSILTSLKSKLSGGGSTDHVVTIDSGGGHGGGHSGWHRSLPYITPSPPIHFAAAAEEEHHHEIPQVSEYYSHDTSSQKDDYKFI